MNDEIRYDSYGNEIPQPTPEQIAQAAAAKKAKDQADYNAVCDNIFSRIAVARGQSDVLVDEAVREGFMALKAGNLIEARQIAEKAEREKAKADAYSKFAHGEIGFDEARKAGIIL
jgi:hypothetical protein